MRVVLKDFQVEAVGELADKFSGAQTLAATSNPVAVLLNAPTGSGKTMMMTALIDQLLAGDENGTEGDPDLVFLWLTDDPELNKQSASKLLATSSVLTAFNVRMIDASVNSETLSPGNVYFLNTQKLGLSTSYVKKGDGRDYTVWEIIENTIAAGPTKFVLIIDEAHRGARGKEAELAETIMQKFVKGDVEIGMVPLIIGVSATPDRFINLCTTTNRPLLRVDVPPEKVRESGLLKEFVDLYHPDEKQPNRATMLVEAIESWKIYCTGWEAYGKTEGESVPVPILLVQVEDARSGTGQVSATDMAMVMRTLVEKVVNTDDRWIAHAFQEGSVLNIDGHMVRHLAPSLIDADSFVKVVLFKSSLNTGWDCPRAETMVSFRSAKDETNIAQLVGRMVRAPLARRIDADEHLNTVALYLPYYDSEAVKKVVERLTGDPDSVPPTKVREGSAAVTLVRAKGSELCFEALDKLPTYAIPRSRSTKPIPRLGKVASLLGELGLEADPVKTYRGELVTVLLAEHKRLAKDAEFMRLSNEASLLDMRRRRIALATKNKVNEESVMTKATIADADLDMLHADSGRTLGEGLHQEYLRRRVKVDKVDSRVSKIELAALVAMPGVLEKVNNAAEAKRKQWIRDHKVAINGSGEKYRQVLRDIEGAGSEPELSTISVQSTIEGVKAVTAWNKHIYVESDGMFHYDFTSSWERKVVELETTRADIIGWIRNPDRKPWSLCAPRLDGTKWVGIYPDFIFFRQTKSGIQSDIVDPHLLNDKDAPARAAALASFADKHANHFGRIEMMIFASDSDKTGKRIDLMDKAVRNRVAQVKDHAHLKDIFDQAS